MHFLVVLDFCSKNKIKRVSTLILNIIGKSNQQGNVQTIQTHLSEPKLCIISHHHLPRTDDYSF